MTIRTVVMTALLGAALGGSAVHAQAGDVSGVWQTQAGDANVRVSKCGTQLCGVIVSLRDKIDPRTGRAPIDDKNLDPKLATRSMIGIHLFFGMKPNGPNAWSGQIYNADDGRYYVSNVALTGPNSLKVEGCVGAICGGENWSRVGR